MNKLPMSVIGGYLGAGKTTLINQLLSGNHGSRILVLVNDFGAINIDAGLLISADEDTIELANGCVCCTMGADLFLAIGDVLDRQPRPDHLVIEASGVANPARIANVAKAEPDLSYAGITTVLDGARYAALLSDPQIGDQVASQITCADLLAVSKGPVSAEIKTRLQDMAPGVPVLATGDIGLQEILLSDAVLKSAHSPHAAYTRWSHQGAQRWAEASLRRALAQRPDALYRVKGWVKGAGGKGWQVQAVGPDIDLTSVDQPDQSQLVGIGLATNLSEADCQAWFDAHASKDTAEVALRSPRPIKAEEVGGR